MEGPSDELIVQRAYRDAHDNRLPIHDGIDVMSMDALSAKRFLDIAVLLKKPVVVVTDNDGDEAAARARYAAYAQYRFIRICIGKGEPGDAGAPTPGRQRPGDAQPGAGQDTTTRTRSCWPT